MRLLACLLVGMATAEKFAELEFTRFRGKSCRLKMSDTDPTIISTCPMSNVHLGKDILSIYSARATLLDAKMAELANALQEVQDHLTVTRNWTWTRQITSAPTNAPTASPTKPCPITTITMGDGTCRPCGNDREPPCTKAGNPYENSGGCAPTTAFSSFWGGRCHACGLHNEPPCTAQGNPYAANGGCSNQTALSTNWAGRCYKCGGHNQPPCTAPGNKYEANDGCSSETALSTKNTGHCYHCGWVNEPACTAKGNPYESNDGCADKIFHKSTLQKLHADLSGHCQPDHSLGVGALVVGKPGELSTDDDDDERKDDVGSGF